MKGMKKGEIPTRKCPLFVFFIFSWSSFFASYAMKLRRVWLIFACLICWSVTTPAQIEFDKPKNKEPLPTPYTINATRDQVLDAARALLKSCKISYQEKVERVLPVGDKLVTRYINFAKGVNTRTDLAHYANLPAGDVHAWTAGRVFLEIIALPLDAKRSQISIGAHFQGRTAGIMTGGKEEWVDVPSNRRLEDEVLRGLTGKILGLDLSIDGDGRRRLLNCEY